MKLHPNQNHFWVAIHQLSNAGLQENSSRSLTDWFVGLVEVEVLDACHVQVLTQDVLSLVPLYDLNVWSSTWDVGDEHIAYGWNHTL